MRVECPKLRCQKSRWTATGRTWINRHGKLCAQVVCGRCGYVWWTRLPEAMEACRVVRAADGLAMPEEPTPEAPRPTPMPLLPFGSLPAQPVAMTPVRTLAQAGLPVLDATPRQTGETE